MAKIKFLPSAQKDINEALDYFLSKNPRSAEIFAFGIEKAVNVLKDFPEVAPISKDKMIGSQKYRVLILEYDYLMFYKIHDDMVVRNFIMQ